jgi:hypothetical protein
MGQFQHTCKKLSRKWNKVTVSRDFSLQIFFMTHLGKFAPGINDTGGAP